ncbi:hypothetical protein B0H10DRAFT_2084962, partial [Mycena sp. CBHHK59/15]
MQPPHASLPPQLHRIAQCEPYLRPSTEPKWTKGLRNRCELAPLLTPRTRLQALGSYPYPNAHLGCIPTSLHTSIHPYQLILAPFLPSCYHSLPPTNSPKPASLRERMTSLYTPPIPVSLI